MKQLQENIANCEMKFVNTQIDILLVQNPLKFGLRKQGNKSKFQISVLNASSNTKNEARIYRIISTVLNTRSLVLIITTFSINRHNIIFLNILSIFI